MDNNYLYELKPSLITPTENSYLIAIKNALPAGYFVQPQVNLASIIKRTDGATFHNELFRNIDACIFDMSYKPIVLIEINDSSHNLPKRKERDKRVKKICEEAGIQIITFWTNYGINQEYIFKKINEAISNAYYVPRIANSKLQNVPQTVEQNYQNNQMYGNVSQMPQNYPHNQMYNIEQIPQNYQYNQMPRNNKKNTFITLLSVILGFFAVIIAIAFILAIISTFQ